MAYFINIHQIILENELFIIEIDNIYYVAILIDVENQFGTFRFYRRNFRHTDELKFEFPLIEHYLRIGLNSKHIKAWVKEYRYGRGEAVYINAIVGQLFYNLN